MFITFEGIEGSGKSLQIARAYEYVQRKGLKCILTREPGGTDFGLALRKVLLGTDGCHREPWCELLLYLADRYQHLKEVVQPAVSKGCVVLSDRYQDATRAYQGAARGIPLPEIEAVAQIMGIIEPDKTVLLDLDVETAIARARTRNAASPAAAAEGRFEAEDLEFHKRVRAAYLDLARQWPQRIRIVDAAGTPDEVFSRIAAILDSWFPG
ncbi:MAG: dTMP kinase [Acidobacteriota bacterium]|nr:dTMP kinase [Acidobacteriota bacterium]